MVTNVTSLLKTVKAVEDEATRGTRALEATIEYIKQELTVKALYNDACKISRSSKQTLGPRPNALKINKLRITASIFQASSYSVLIQRSSAFVKFAVQCCACLHYKICAPHHQI